MKLSSAMNQNADTPAEELHEDPTNVIKIYPGPFVASLIITRPTVAQQFVAKMASNVDDREEESRAEWCSGELLKCFRDKRFSGRGEKWRFCCI